MKVEDNRPLIFKTIGYCFNGLLKILGGKNLLGGQKSFLGAIPCSRKPGNKGNSTIATQIDQTF